MSLRGLLKGKAEVRRGYLKSRSGRRPMRVSTLLRKEKDGSLEKYTKLGAAEDPTENVDKIAARVDYREGDDPQTTGMPAFAQRGKKQLPSREEMDLNPTPKVESRQENRGTVLSDQYTQASGTDDVGKYASGYSKAERAAELIGLGTIAAGPASDMLARHRARKAGLDPSTMSEHDLDKHQVLKHEHHAPADLAGLGILAAPYASKRWGELLAKHGAAVTENDGALTGSLLSPSQKGWDKISRENVGSAGPEKHSLQPTYTSLADISTSVGQGESKTSAAHYSLMRSLLKFSQVHPSNGLPPRKQPDHKDGLAYGDSMYDIPAGVAVSDGLGKTAAMALDLGLIREETFSKLSGTQESLDKLKKLEDTRPGAGEVARGALVGGAVSPLADIAHRAMSGAEARGGKPILLRGASGKLLARPHMARAAQGAVLGGLVPVGRHFLERESAKQKLRESVGQSNPDTFRSGIKRTVGL